MNMKPIYSKILVGLVCFGLGVGSMVISQRATKEKPPSTSFAAPLVGQKDSGTDQLLDHFFNDDFFGKSEDPFSQMRKMREQMMKQFNPPEKGAAPFDSWYQKKFGGGDVADISQREDDKFVYYDISVKGLNKEDLKVKVANGQINISGKTETKNENGNTGTYMSSMFQRSFPVPPNVDSNKVQMENEKDKLTVKFPKTA
jgi:HSP20 family molecular chaperone IbpA